MKGDVQSYGRASVVSALGLVLQAGAAALLGVYAGLSSGDMAATTAAIHAAIGLLVWAPLVFLFDLHKRERREAVEIEQLAHDEPTGMFEAAEIPRAARSLDALRRYVLPGLSLLIGLSLLAVGLTRLRGASGIGEAAANAEVLHQGFGIAAGLAVAVAGFVFARFVSGMATQQIWAPLKAGASYAVGTALLGLVIAVARFIDTSLGRPVALETVSHAVPIFTMVIGAEMLLNFVLDIYRPRKPGEDPRPGFDSRLLGLLAAPDRIAENIGEALNYQFGVEVSRTWFYQLIRRWWPGLLAVALLVAWGMTSLVVIEPHQRAMVLRFGSPSAPLVSFGQRDGDEIGPGLHVVLPWPMTEVYVPRSSHGSGTDTGETLTATGVRVLRLGTNPPKEGEPVLWTNEHTVQELYSLVQPATIGVDDGAETTGDVSTLSLVAVEVPVQYVIDSVQAFDTLAQPEHRDALLDVLGERRLMQHLASRRIDEILGGSRTELNAEITEELKGVFSAIPGGDGEAVDAGIRLLQVGVAGVHPPQKAAVYFERVVQAKQITEAKVEAAVEYEARVLNSVTPPIERAGGDSMEASDIVAMIEDLASMRDSGVGNTALAARELEIQRLLEEAGGGAGALLVEAGAERWERHMGERARASLFAGQVASYRASPSLYMSSYYFDALLSVMRDSRVFLTGEKIENLEVNLEMQSLDTSIEVFDTELGSEGQMP